MPKFYGLNQFVPLHIVRIAFTQPIEYSNHVLIPNIHSHVTIRIEKKKRFLDKNKKNVRKVVWSIGNKQRKKSGYR
jgi:hypothetical protein